MEPQLKQRLVGISVIFALAVIFLPMILDGSGQGNPELDTDIPVAPVVESRVNVREQVIELKREVEEIPLIAPLIVDNSSAKPVEPVAVVDEPKSGATAKTVESRKAPDESPVSTDKAPPSGSGKSSSPVQKPATAKPAPGGESWVLQVGSFRDRDKAFAHRDKLRKAELAAVFIEQHQHEGGLRYRVRFGPFLNRDRGRVVQNKVLAKYNIKGLLMRYEQ